MRIALLLATLSRVTAAHTPRRTCTRRAAIAMAAMAFSHAPRKVAVGQMTSTNDIDANYAVCARLANDAAAQSCAMLFLPECFAYMGHKGSDANAIAEPLDGKLMARYRALAASSGLWLSLGGFPETGPDAHHRYNTHVVVDDTGAIRAAYRKIHLFDVDVPNGPVLRESETAARGADIVTVASTPIGALGLSICYDVRFPELYSKMRFEQQAEVMSVPSAFTRVTGEAHWEILLRARAIETQCYVVAAAQAGAHSATRHSYGHAMIIDPWGKIVAKVADPDAGVGIAVAEIDLEALRSVRLKIPVAAHRLPLHDAVLFPSLIR